MGAHAIGLSDHNLDHISAKSAMHPSCACKHTSNQDIFLKKKRHSPLKESCYRSTKTAKIKKNTEKGTTSKADEWNQPSWELNCTFPLCRSIVVPLCHGGYGMNLFLVLMWLGYVFGTAVIHFGISFAIVLLG
jgi:hypothetical protein